jgi:hypothetical protein
MMRLDRLDVAWLMLVGLALAAVAISSSAQSVLLGDAVVLMLAAIKGRKIVLDYLDLRNAAALWRGLVMAWVILVAAFAWAAAAVHVLI